MVYIIKTDEEVVGHVLSGFQGQGSNKEPCIGHRDYSYARFSDLALLNKAYRKQYLYIHVYL